MLVYFMLLTLILDLDLDSAGDRGDCGYALFGSYFNHAHTKI